MKKYLMLLMPVLILFFALSVNSYAESIPKPTKKKVVSKNPLPVVGTQEKLKSILKAGENFRQTYSGIRLGGEMAGTMKNEAQKDTVASGATWGSDDHSATNVQVQGVDEADTVKTDGQYIYQVKNQQVIIARANPAEKLEVVETLKYNTQEFGPSEIYVDKEHLVVIGNTYYPLENKPEVKDSQSKLDSRIGILPVPMGRQTVKAIVYDITNINSIKKIRESEIEGNYLSSRKIGSSIYLITNKYIDYYYIMEQKAEAIPTPVYREGEEKFSNIALKDIRYFPNFTQPNYLIVAGLDLNKPQKKLNIQTFLGSGETIYSSKDNLYIAVTQYENPTIKVESKKNVKAKKMVAEESITTANTTLYKFGLKEGSTTYIAKGQVPGNILNQFSMDEFEGNFRIATTVGNTWQAGENTSKNNIYVLDPNLKTIGKLENLAPGERIYSVRFMGKRGYLVTFKQVDPLFVIDLQTPNNPKVLGELKIPGFSNYLHPYDENHLIGFGKDTTEGETAGTALVQGMKVALFDVTDVIKPIEKFKAIIGDRGTDSELLYNHKVLLFNKAKNLLAFPVTVTETKKDPNNGFAYGVPAFQGAYVYNLDLDKGFTLRGKVSHFAKPLNTQKPEDFDWNKSIQRILYIGDNLYTLSNAMIKANSLEDLKELNSISVNN